MDIFIITAAIIGLSSLLNRVNASHYALSTTHVFHNTPSVTGDPALPLPPPLPSPQLPPPLIPPSSPPPWASRWRQALVSRPTRS